MSARPFLKWTGGKRQLLPELLKRVPSMYGVYHEPFVGGGALFFALRPPVARLGDMNPRLVRCYRAIRDNVDDLIGLLSSRYATNTAGFFYATRAAEPSDPVEVAAWMIYLNKTCFNGLWRVNKAGKFNAPFGKYDNPAICDEENLRACSAALKAGLVTIENEDFESVDGRAKAGDFVYFDPPYVPLSETSSFAAYTAGGFGPRDQERLRDLALTLKRRGVHVLLSNSGAPAVEKLYSADFTIAEVMARRSINKNASGRGAIVEYVIS